jgi:hypothetical protein
MVSFVQEDDTHEEYLAGLQHSFDSPFLGFAEAISPIGDAFGFFPASPELPNVDIVNRGDLLLNDFSLSGYVLEGLQQPDFPEPEDGPTFQTAIR